MLREPTLGERFMQHLSLLLELNREQLARYGPDHGLAPAIRYYAHQLQRAERVWHEIGADPLGRFVRLRNLGRLELITSTASHAYLPGLSQLTSAVSAQVRLGRRAFAGFTGLQPAGLWLPECAFAPPLDEPLGQANVGYSILDIHGLRNAWPQPEHDGQGPIISPHGLAYFGRDRQASHQVWSRQNGYPGDPWYREFHRDLGHELPDADLAGLGAGTMTGLKYYRITGPGPDKRPYDPVQAHRRCALHARHFVKQRLLHLSQIAAMSGPPISVAAYDAELFGHWWAEGPAFLENIFRQLAACERLRPTSLESFVRAHRCWPLATPAASSWGEGGYGQVWVGPRTAHLWRAIHQTHHRVVELVRQYRHAVGPKGLAVDQAIRELMLLQASDWLFMIHTGQLAAYGQQRLDQHQRRIEKLLAIARQSAVGDQDQRWLATLNRPGGYLSDLQGEQLRDVF